MDEKQYNEYIKQITPTHNTFLNVLKAFLTGGIICTIGQALNQWFSSGMNMEKTEASAWTLIVLIGLSILLTGLNIFPRIVKFGGAGALVPITGFANAVVSPAIDFKSEGFVTGMAAKMFTVAGPVIVFGTLASVIYGILLKLFG